MIQSFADATTQDLFDATDSKAARRYRITFRFDHGHAHDVRCEDYHA